jgi:hypothetical protein
MTDWRRCRDLPVLVLRQRCLGRTGRRSGGSRYIVSGVCAARGGCARFGCHRLSLDVTGGVRTEGGVLVVELMGAIYR